MSLLLRLFWAVGNPELETENVRLAADNRRLRWERDLARAEAVAAKQTACRALHPANRFKAMSELMGGMCGRSGDGAELVLWTEVSS